MVHYRIHNSQTPVPNLSQVNPVHTFTPYFLKLHSNIIILPSTPRKFPSAYPTKILPVFLILSMRSTCATNLIHLELITLNNSW